MSAPAKLMLFVLISTCNCEPRRIKPRLAIRGGAAMTSSKPPPLLEKDAKVFDAVSSRLQVVSAAMYGSAYLKLFSELFSEPTLGQISLFVKDIVIRGWHIPILIEFLVAQQMANAAAHFHKIALSHQIVDPDGQRAELMEGMASLQKVFFNQIIPNCILFATAAYHFVRKTAPGVQGYMALGSVITFTVARSLLVLRQPAASAQMFPVWSAIGGAAVQVFQRLVAPFKRRARD